MYQSTTLIGNVGNDPEMRYTPTGTPVCTFSLAVNKSWTGKDGQRNDQTTWFRVTTWNKTAEIVNQYLVKGRQVMVAGEMQQPNAYIDKDGGPRANLEITAREVKFLGNRGDAAPGTQHQSSQAPTQSEAGGIAEEEIPF